MRTHVKRIVSRCFASLRQLRQIRHSVPTATLQMLVVALVHSRLDYGNSVLVGLPAYLSRQLQSVLNSAARLIVVYHLKSRDHTYQSSLVAGPRTYTVQDGCSDIQSPAWRRTTLPVFASACRRALRSVGSNRLQIPPFKLSTVGGRTFSVTAAQFWNRLPDNVTSANSLSAFQQQTHSVPSVIPRHYPVTFNCNTHSGPSSGIAT